MNIRRAALAFALAIALPATAADPDPRIAAELESALVRLTEMGALANAGEQDVVIDRPARLRYELGTVVDTRADPAGLPVLAVTPGGAAAALGLQVGDRLLEVNGKALTSVADPGPTLLAAVEGEKGMLDVRLRRADQELQLSGRAEPVYVPGFQLAVQGPGGSDAGCGRVSVNARPPVSERIYPLVLHEIDGRLPGPSGAEVFRLGVGRHFLKVSEAIDPDRFTGQQNRQRSQWLFRHERFKYLELDVAADTNYRLGARLIDANRNDIRGGSYWEPVVWREVAEPCR